MIDCCYFSFFQRNNSKPVSKEVNYKALLRKILSVLPHALYPPLLVLADSLFCHTEQKAAQT